MSGKRQQQFHGRFDLEKLVRAGIRRLEPYSSARDKTLDGILLDANENPFPWEWQGTKLNRYPDPQQRRLREALARELEIEFDQVLAGTGSDEVIDWILKVFCEPGRDRVAVAVPSYGMYRVQADILGIEVVPLLLTEEFDLDISLALSRLDESVNVIFLCSPNNPTGNTLNRDELVKLLRNWNGIVVVDEAYCEFSDTPSLLSELDQFPNLILMRTFSKARGAAGLRLGYVVGSAQIIDYFRRVKLPYNLSRPVQALGLEALARSDWKRQVTRIRDERERVAAVLNGFSGIEVLPSQANFLLFRCPGASHVYESLYRKGIVIRNRSGLPGLDSCLRISIGTRGENDRFLKEIQSALEEQPHV